MSKEAPVQTADRDVNQFAQELFDPLPARYDRLEALLSLGQNARWRQAMVSHVVDVEPRSVLDVATGTAGVAIEIAQRSDADVTGIDLTAAMLRSGRDAINRAHAAARAFGSSRVKPNGFRFATRRSTR